MAAEAQLSQLWLGRLGNDSGHVCIRSGRRVFSTGVPLWIWEAHVQHPTRSCSNRPTLLYTTSILSPHRHVLHQALCRIVSPTARGPKEMDEESADRNYRFPLRLNAFGHYRLVCPVQTDSKELGYQYTRNLSFTLGPHCSSVCRN